MTVATELITAEALAKMGDIGPCELIEGVIQRMAPAGHQHGTIVANLCFLLNQHVKPRALGRVSGGDTGVVLSRDPDTVRAPDVMFVSSEQLPRSGAIRGFISFAPDLAAEVISPDDRWTEIEQKVAQYLAAGVRLVWVVDPQAEWVHVYRPGREKHILQREETLTADNVLPEFSCQVGQLFD